MPYVVSGLPLETFQPLFGQSDEGLAAQGIVRCVSDAPVGFPCRVTLSDVEPGRSLLLLNYEHQAAPTPYRSAHAIFVDEQAQETAVFMDQIPPVLSARPFISLRAFDAGGMMVDATVALGAQLEPHVIDMLARRDVAYLHAHNAGRGCFAARIDRAPPFAP
jgi:hypothetical protein